MSIERITKEEFQALRPIEAKGRRSEETEALLVLPRGTGIKMPCRWQHDKHNACPGAALLVHVGYRYNFKVLCVCRAGVLYAWKKIKEPA